MIANFRIAAARLWNTPAIRSALVAFLILRLLTLFVATIGYVSQPARVNLDEQPIYNLYNTVVVLPDPIKTLMTPWYRWDTGWYIYIAYEGYQQNDLMYAFPPLYPVLIRLVAMLVGDYLFAALLISNLACIAFFILLYQRLESTFGHHRARWTLIVLAIFPTSYYLVAGYADSLGLALGLAAWASVDRQRYTRAGLLGTLAGLARPQMWVIVLPMLYSLWVRFWAENPTISLKHPAFRQTLLRWTGQEFGAVWALVGAGLGTAVYLFLPGLFGVALQELAWEVGWNSSFAFPGIGFINAISDVITNQATLLEILNIIGLSILLIGVVVGWKRLDWGNWLYMAGTVFVLSLILNERVHLEAMLRYMVHVYPIFLLLSGWIATNNRNRLTYYVLSGILSVLAVYLFTNWVWIG